MKLSIALASIVAGTATAKDFNVRVACSGINQSALSLKALSFSAKALEDSFNAVYGTTTNSALKQVSSTGLGVEQCNKCDDEIASVLTFAVTGTGPNLEQCNKCDDELGENREAWEDEFAKAVSSGPFEAFLGATECSITAGDAIENDATHKEIPIVVDVQCDSLDFGDLSVEGLVFSSKALQDTYNGVHEAIDGSKMSDVVLSALGVEQCNKCDDAFLGVAHDTLSFTGKVSMTSKGLKSGENQPNFPEQAAKVVTSYSIFHPFGKKVTQCNKCDDAELEQCNKCDDALLDEHLDSRVSKLAMSGLGVEQSRVAQCNKCDDLMMNVQQCNKCDDETFDRSISVATKAWEGLFLSRVLLNPNGEFASAEGCTITMKHA